MILYIYILYILLSCYITLYYITLYYVVLCYVMLCYVMLYIYIIFFSYILLLYIPISCYYYHLILSLFQLLFRTGFDERIKLRHACQTGKPFAGLLRLGFWPDFAWFRAVFA